MASLIHELENNEALLLMFLSGELPPEDQLEVQQMLAADAGLRSDLERIQSAHNTAMTVLAKLDGDPTAVPAENHAIRQAIRAMKQWQVDRLSRQPVIIPARRSKIPVWMYPLASAAALLIGTIAWWGFGGQFHAPGAGSSPTDGSSGLPDNQTAVVIAPSSDEVAAARLTDSLSNDAPASDASIKISEAETQASLLVARSDGSSATSEISLDEGNP